jgi:hypothetical protein
LKRRLRLHISPSRNCVKRLLPTTLFFFPLILRLHFSRGFSMQFNIFVRSTMLCKRIAMSSAKRRMLNFSPCTYTVVFNFSFIPFLALRIQTLNIIGGNAHPIVLLSSLPAFLSSSKKWTLLFCHWRVPSHSSVQSAF